MLKLVKMHGKDGGVPSLLGSTVYICAILNNNGHHIFKTYLAINSNEIKYNEIKSVGIQELT